MNRRKHFELSEKWYIAMDPDNVGRESGWESRVADGAVDAYVPSIIQQFFPDCHGVAYYWCAFTPRLDVEASDRVNINFGGVDYKAEVWLNGDYLGAVEGGETPFSFDVTDALREGENLLAVRVVNPTDKFIDGLTLQNTPHRNKEVHKCAGCNLNHGGIWYGVSLSVLPNIYIADKLLEGDIHSGELKARAEVRSFAGEAEDCEVTLSVYSNDAYSGKVAETSVRYTAGQGDSECTLALTVDSPKLWSTDAPNLYRVELSIESRFGKHTQSQKFGFREFMIKDGFFYLNGKKIFLRSSHSGNAFPIGQMLPVRPDHIRKDFIYAKAAGFNMIRCISGLYRPEQMDVADEIGMLIYDECFASWCMSYSAVDSWRSHEEFLEMLKRHPKIPVGDEGALSDRWINATERMIRRDRNRTCVVVWGMLNETYPSSIFNTAHAFLPRLRELDPSRAVVLNSGRWDNDYSIGSASNPYSSVWENTWGDDGDVSKQPERFKTDATGDTHYYPVAPISDADANVFRQMGHNTARPQFLSEFGVGSQFNVIEEYRHFMQHGERLDLEDSAWLGLQSRQLEADFDRLGLVKIFPFPEAMLKESQRINADERKRHFDILRSNSRLAGYSLTGLLDHGMCGEGLWSYWRRWKPEMFDAISEGWAPLRFCLFAPATVYSGDSFEIECVLANDGVLKSGSYTADIAITGEQGVVRRFTVEFELDGDELAVPVMKRTVKPDLPEGRYKLEADLREGAPTATSTHFYVIDREKHKKGSASLFGIENEALSELIDVNADGKLLLVGKADADSAAELIAKAEQGATVVFLDCNSLRDGAVMEKMRGIVPDLAITDHRDWLYHKEYVLYDRELFDGLGRGLLELIRFKREFPHAAFATEKTPDYIGCPGFLTGYYGMPSGYGMLYGMLGFDCGKGRVIFNSFELLGSIGSPTADRMLTNLVSELGGSI